MSTTKTKVKFTVLGEPASKANSRKITKNRKTGNPQVIKSEKARNYVTMFQMQCPQIEPPIIADVRVTIHIYYASRRPDLDESVILDCMQTLTTRGHKGERVVLRNNIYRNDRQVKEKHIYWHHDPENPRSEIMIEAIDDCS